MRAAATTQRSAPAWICAFLLGGGCEPLYDPCFSPQSVVSDLRVLAVRADPPEALVDLTRGNVPPVQVRALVVGPDGPVQGAQVSARVCAPADDGCPPGSSALSATTRRDGETSFSVQASPELIQKALESDRLRGHGGIRVQLDLDASSGAQVATARKLLLYTPDGPGVVPNHGLEVDRMQVIRAGQIVQTVAPGDAAQMLTNTPYGLRPLLAPGSIEEYDAIDLSGQRVHLVEHITYAFYSTPHLIFGDVRIIGGNVIFTYQDVAGGDVADEPDPGAPAPTGGLVRVQAVQAIPSHVWVVARDGRGAVAWMWMKVSLELFGRPKPEFGCK